MPPRGRPRKVGLKRMDAAVDNLRPMGFSPDSIRSKVKSLLHVYGGDEAWPVIEEASYRLVIEALLEDQELQNQDAPEGEGTGAQDGMVGEQLECEPSCTADVHLGADHQDAALSSPVTVDPADLPPAAEQNQVEEDVVNTTENIAAFIDACGNSPPPGFEHVIRQGCEKTKREPCLGWIGPKDDDDFVLLKPYPFQRSKERPRSHVSRWDMRPDDFDAQML